MSHLKFTNSHIWQIAVTLWLLLEQSVLYMIKEHLHNLGVHCLSKRELGTADTFKLILPIPSMNYFVELLNGPCHSIA